MTIQSWRSLFGVAAFCIGGQLTALHAEPPQPAAAENSAADKPATSVVTDANSKQDQTVKPEQIAQWVKELDHDDYKIRQQAKDNLIAAGTQALEPLTAAIGDGNLEVLSQGMGVLRAHVQGSDAKLSAAAKQTLEKIRGGSNATAAQRAKQILEPAPVAVPPDSNTARAGRAVRLANPRIQVVPNGIQAVPLPIQIQQGNIQLAPGAAIQVQARAIAENGNGERHIKVNENGKEVEITVNKEGVKVVTTENGKTQEYKAKDLDELRKIHPDGFKLHEQYTKFGGNAIQFGGLAPVAVPIPAVPRNVAQTQLELAERMLEQAERLVQRSADSADSKEALKTTLQKLAEAAELRKAVEKNNAPPAAQAANNAAAELEKAKREIEKLREEVLKRDELDRDAIRKSLEAELLETRKKLEADRTELQKLREFKRDDSINLKKAELDEVKSKLDAEKSTLEEKLKAEK